MRVAVAAAVTVALLPVVAGCGRGQSYCDRVHDHQSDLGSIARGADSAALLQALPIFEDLRDAAPDDVADDWQLLVGRIRAWTPPWRPPTSTPRRTTRSIRPPA